jgi:hypothetical protein
VPGHHREVHRCGDEAAWWKNFGVDPTIPARALWMEMHPLPTTTDKMGSAHPSTIGLSRNVGACDAARVQTTGTDD